jgi:hypothetical protein
MTLFKKLVLFYFISSLTSFSGAVVIYCLYYGLKSELFKITEHKKQAQNNARRVSAMING